MKTELDTVLDAIESCFGDKKLFDAYLSAFDANSVAQKPYVMKVKDIVKVGVNSFSTKDPMGVLDFNFDVQTYYPRIDVFGANNSIYTPSKGIYRPKPNRALSVVCSKDLKGQGSGTVSILNFDDKNAGFFSQIAKELQEDILLYNS